MTSPLQEQWKKLWKSLINDKDIEEVLGWNTEVENRKFKIALEKIIKSHLPSLLESCLPEEEVGGQNDSKGG